MTSLNKYKRKAIRGAKGGGKGGGGDSGRVAQESPDSLRSKAWVEVLLAVSEGEVEGLVDGAKSIYLDGTPLQNSDGSFNFTGFQYEERPGTQNQSHIALLSDTESSVDVGAEVTADTPLIITITDEDIDAERIIIGVPQLTEQNTTNGDITGSSITLAIDLQSDGGGYVEKEQFTITGKTTSRYQISKVVNLTGDAPWDIRVRRVTPDSDSLALVNKTFVDSRVDIIRQKLTYPNTALFGGRFDSSQFTKAPTIGLDMKLKRIRVPSNYDPSTRSYDGIWDGTFTIAWSDNPAWVLYDMLTDTRYGAGEYISQDDVDKWAFYEAAQYCDELVPDGFGGMEPRFACNAYFQSRAQAYKVLRDLASVFRAMPYWTSGAITITQDRPTDPSAIFNPSNVIDGKFTYSGSSLDVRKTVALVSWNDPQNFYKPAIEYVENLEAIARYGYRETEVQAVACTSRGQAHRVGAWLTSTEYSEPESVSFNTGQEGANAAPGEVCIIQDPTRAGRRLAGRIQGYAAGELTLDMDVNAIQEVDLNSTLTIVLPGGALEERGIVSINANAVTLDSELSTDDVLNAIYIIQTTAIVGQLWRCVSVVEGKGGVHEYVALSYNADKYPAIEQGLKFEAPRISVLTQVPAQPGIITVTESLYESSNGVKVLISVDWPDVTYAMTYEWAWRRNGGNFTPAQRTTHSNFDIRDAMPGEYEFVITAISAAEKRSLPAFKSQTILGKTAPPADVDGLSGIVTDRNALLVSWNPTQDLDVRIGGWIQFRHTPVLLDDGAVWEHSVDIGPLIPGSATSAPLPLLDGTYFAKFIDEGGRPSVNAVAISMTAVNVLRMNVVETVTESPAFAGAKTDVVYDAGMGTGGAIKLASAGDFDGFPGEIDDWDNFDNADGVADSGVYDFDDIIDLGEVYEAVRLSILLQVESFNAFDRIDSRMGLMDDWPNMDGSNTGDTDAKVYVSATEDDPSAPGAVWSDWALLFSGDYRGRAFKAQARLYSYNDEENIAVTALAFTADMPDHTEQENTIVSGAGVKSVDFPTAFYNVPSLGIVAYGMASGDRYEVSNKDSTGFDIAFYNSVGAAINRTFDYVAAGYGRRI